MIFLTSRKFQSKICQRIIRRLFVVNILSCKVRFYYFKVMYNFKYWITNEACALGCFVEHVHFDFENEALQSRVSLIMVTGA